jgi:hypothetical protein
LSNSPFGFVWKRSPILGLSRVPSQISMWGICPSS